MTTRIPLAALLFISGVGLGWFGLWERPAKSGRNSVASVSPGNCNDRESTTDFGGGAFDELLKEDERLRGSGTADLRRWLDSLKEQADSGIVARIVRRWAEIAPAEALNYLKTVPEFESSIAVVMECWAASDWRAAVNAAADDDEDDVNGFLKMAGLATGLPVENLFDAFETLRSRKGDDRSLAAFFYRLGEVDGQMAIELALDFCPKAELTYQRHEAIERVLTGWFKSSGTADQILDWCNGKDAAVQQAVHTSLFNVWSKTEAAKALDALWPHLDHSDGQAISRLQPTSDEDLRSCIAWVGKNVESPDTAQRMMGQLLDSTSGVPNPGIAIEAVELLDSELRESAATRIDYAIKGWLGRDEATAMKWLNQLPDGWLKGVAEGAAIGKSESAQYSDMGILKEALRTSLSAGNAEHYISKLLQERIDEGASLDSVRTVAKSLLEASPEAVRAFVRQFQETAPVETLDFIMESGHPESGFYMERSLVNWASQDPLAASEWVTELPESDNRNSGLLNVATAWSKIDRTAVQNWFDTLPDRDKATLLIAGSHSDVSIVSTEQVLANIHSIDGSDERRNVARSALMSLAADNPQAAQARLDSLGLDEAGTTTIRQQLDEAAALRKWLAR
ncbi:MAG: hypothetical protein R3F19_27700 [Verrucomicrobiales bacterium]